MEVKFNIRRIVIGLIIFLSIVNIYFYLKSPVINNYHLQAIKDTLYKGDRIIYDGGFARGLCTQVNFADYPELDKKAEELDSILSREFPNKHESCVKKAKLVKLVYEPDLKQAIAVYRCEYNGIGEELKVSNYQDSCDYTQYLTKWNFPIGKYTQVPIP